MKTVIKFFCATLILMVFTGCSTESIDEPITDAINSSQDVDVFFRSDNSRSDVVNPINNMEIVGSSILHRKRDRISVNFKTTDLAPGYAYTLWWVIWNNPQECAIPEECNDSDFGNAEAVGVEVLYATGLVADDSGIGNFSASLSVDDDSESVNVPFGLPHRGGLESGNTLSSEVHLVLRSHGPAIPELVDEQIGGYFGGCTTFLGVFNEIPDEVGECGDIEFAIHSPVN